MGGPRMLIGWAHAGRVLGQEASMGANDGKMFKSGAERSCPCRPFLDWSAGSSSGSR